MSDTYTLTEDRRSDLQAESMRMNAIIEAAANVAEALAGENGGKTIDALEALLRAAHERGRELNNALDSTAFKS